MIKNEILNEKYMHFALDLAARAEGKTSPNPMVGAVIVKQGKIIGKGYHKKAGWPHAEINALKDASRKCSGAEMFVTLEPCDHHGRTPPCTQAIIKSGIKKIHIAMKDPNPVNNGGGVKALRRAGIAVEIGLCGEEAEKMNRKYLKYVRTGMPYVTAKVAQSMDGKVAAADGTSKWISSDLSRRYVKELRSKYDAVLVGSNTVKADDPTLFANGAPGVTRIIVDTRLGIKKTSKLVQTSDKRPLIICTTELADSKKTEFFQKKGIELIFSKSRGGRVPLEKAFAKLAEKGIINILVEGGGILLGSLLDAVLLDEVIFFIAPKLLGGKFSSISGEGVSTIKKMVQIENISTKILGEDILVTGLIKK